jgi:hypothetical protein
MVEREREQSTGVHLDAIDEAAEVPWMPVLLPC